VNNLLVRDGVFRENQLERTLTKHKYPVRNVSERISDLRAQIAACRKGMSELMQVIGRYGFIVVTDYMRYIQENAEYSVKQALQRFLKGSNHFYSTFEDFLMTEPDKG
jgi:N-methylhydantoinase B/oxoprolinase/acetone carboxylase alpha subunit